MQVCMLRQIMISEGGGVSQKGVDRGTRMEVSIKMRGAADTPVPSETPHQRALGFSVQQKGVWGGAGCLVCDW